MSLTLTQSAGGDFTPHPEGIFPAVCVDVIDLGPVTSTWEGQTKTANKLRIVFETEEVGNDHKRMTVSKSFTASLHPKAKLTEFLGKWRGKPVADGAVRILDRRANERKKEDSKELDQQRNRKRLAVHALVVGEEPVMFDAFQIQPSRCMPQVRKLSNVFGHYG